MLLWALLELRAGEGLILREERLLLKERVPVGKAAAAELRVEGTGLPVGLGEALPLSRPGEVAICSLMT